MYFTPNYLIYLAALGHPSASWFRWSFSSDTRFKLVDRILNLSRTATPIGLAGVIPTSIAGKEWNVLFQSDAVPSLEWDVIFELMVARPMELAT